MYLIGFPLLIIPFAIYNMIAFLTPGVNWTDVFTSVELMSGATWTVTTEDLLVGLALILLPLEIFKAARIGNRSIVDRDIVLWYTVSVLHLPRPEDWPVMPVHTADFRLVPVGFFAGNPTAPPNK